MLIPDSNQTEILQGLLTDDYDLPGAYARNLLVFFGLLQYDEPFIIGESLKSGRKIHNYSITNDKDLLKIFPNPCSDYFTVEYNFKEEFNNPVLNLCSLDGKILLTKYLKSFFDQIIIPVSNLKPGVYSVEVKVNGKRKNSQNVIVVK